MNKLTLERKRALEIGNRSHLEMDELLAILRVAQDASLMHWTALLVYFRHAMRSAEVAELRWDNIDLKNGIITVLRKKNGVPTKQTLFRQPGAPLLDEVTALKLWRKEQGYLPGNPFVFTTQKSATHISRETLSRLFRHYATIASDKRDRPIPDDCRHIHILRHTAATILANAPNSNIFDVKALGGWVKMESCLRYSHHDMRRVCEEAQRSVVEALAR